MDRRFHPLPFPLRSTCWLLLIAQFAVTSRAFVNEAHSMIMETASPYVQDGFLVRSDYWSGTLESGKQRLIRHQLFRGNEYWFWAATSTSNAEILLEVYDSEGGAISVEKLLADHSAAARVTPPRTGTYYILLQVQDRQAKTDSSARSVDWALVYGYR